MDINIEIERRLLHTKLVIILIHTGCDKSAANALYGHLSKDTNVSMVTVLTSGSALAKDDVRRLSGFCNAAIVLLISRRSCSDQSFVRCCHLLTGANDGVVVSVRMFGVRIEDQPQCLRLTRGVSMSDSQCDDKEVLDCSKRLREIIVSEINQRITVDLTPRTGNVLTLTVDIVIDGHWDKQATAVVEDVRRQIRDPWSSVRKFLYQLFKVVNIRVVDLLEKHGILLEIITAKRQYLEYIQKYCDSRKMDAMFEECFKSLKKAVNLQFSFSINYLQETSTKNIPVDGATRASSKYKEDNIHSGCSGLNDAVAAWRRSSAVGGIAREIVSEGSGYQPSDLFSQLEKNKGKMIIRDVQDEEGHNLLHMVALSGRSEFFETIFYAGVWDPLRSEMIDRAKDARHGGYTARGLAEKLLHRDIGPLVLAELEHFDELWMTMPFLHRACLLGKTEHVRWICLTDPAAVEKRDSTGGTCILYACASGQVDVVELLVARGGDPTSENRRGENGLLLAAKFARSSMVRYLLDRFRFSKEDEDWRKHRAVDYPAINGDLKTMEAFREGGMPPDARTLAETAKYARIQVVDRLINCYGIQLSGRDSQGRTPLLNAAANGSVKLLEMLLESGADLLDVDKDNRNCLHLVAAGNHVDACKLLVRVARDRRLLGELIDGKDNFSEPRYCTILRGCDHGRPSWHYVLLKRTVEHQLEMAKQSGQVDVKQFAEIRHSGFGRCPDDEARKRIEEDIAASSKANERHPDLTPLALAAYLGHDQVARLLIDEGAKLDVIDHYGNTLLHLAAIRGNMALVQKLAVDEKDVDKPNDDGQSPIDVAELNDHTSVKNVFEGLKQLKYVKKILKFIGESKETLSDNILLSVRASGQDTRLYVIETVRELEVSMYQLLLEMGSGPVLEESSYEQSLKRQEFAGFL